MSANQDFKDLFNILNAEKVEYLIVGAHAVIYYTEPRYTKDLDILVKPTIENAHKVWRALQRFGAPLQGVTIGDFTDPQIIYQIGIEPNRIDILMSIAGVEINSVFENHVTTNYDGIPIRIINKAELIKAKKAAGRLQDQLDLEHLEKI